jgi:hypothetical protein
VPQQRHIYLVRLHLQATNLSDLASEDGKQITSYGLAGERPSNFISTAAWPRQDTPTHHQRRLWRNYISSLFLRYPPYFLHNIGPPSLSPPSTTDPHFPTPEPPASYETLSAYIAALPRTHQRLLSCFTQQCSDLQLWRAFRSKRYLEVVSDGGLPENIGTFGWKIVANKGLVLYQGSGPVDGPFDLANLTRSEIGGFAAPLLLVTVISKYWGIHHRCRFHWIVDSTAAISKVSITIRKGSAPC